MKMSNAEAVLLKHKRGRKPSHVLVQMPREQGRQVIWEAIRARRTFLRIDLEHDTRIGESTIESYLQGLMAAGYLNRQERVRAANGTWDPAVYTLIRDVGAVAPRVTRKGQPVTQGDGRTAQWQSMRILKTFTQSELVSAASASGTVVSAVDVKDYVKHLVQAGYVRVIGERRPGVVTRYLLVPARNTGPLPPQVQKIQQVFDQNLQKVVWPVKS